jgi:hypothetical protein
MSRRRRTYVRDWHGRFSTVAAAKQANKVIEANETPPQPADTNIPLWMKTLRDNQPKQEEEIPRHQYTGKTVTLYHRTSADKAKKIHAEGFYPGTPVFASNKRSGDANSYGESIIEFRAPRKHVSYEEPAAEGERWFSTNAKHTTVVRRRKRKK